MQTKNRSWRLWRSEVAAVLACLCQVLACSSDSGTLPNLPDGALGDAGGDAVATLDGRAGEGGTASTDAATDGNADDGAGAGDSGLADAPAVCTPAGQCSPFATSSCPAGQACRAQAGGTMCGAVAASPRQHGDTCQASYECADGLVCINLNGQGARCQRMCAGNQTGGCGDGFACSTPVAGDACLRLCTPLAPACDIYDPASCPAPNQKCELATHPETGARYTACLAAGTAGPGEACAGGARCGRGLICVNDGAGPACRQVCDARDGAPVCSQAGQSCTGRSTVYGVTFCL